MIEEEQLSLGDSGMGGSMNYGNNEQRVSGAK